MKAFGDAFSNFEGKNYIWDTGNLNLVPIEDQAVRFL
jgi:hypothetical protein